MYFVAMTIKGEAVPSSAVATGTLKHCEKVANRLNRRAHPAVRWVVLAQVRYE